MSRLVIKEIAMNAKDRRLIDSLASIFYLVIDICS